MTSMKAVVVTEYGGRAKAIDMPGPARDAQAAPVLIKVLAAAMNPIAL
jgi:NADPH:quinone reductase-like Zn-dependent oxidoreductase